MALIRFLRARAGLLALCGLLLALLPGGVNAASTPVTLYSLLTNGPAANRLNVVFLSEGYTSNQLAQFLLDATDAMNVLLNKAPFQEYQSYVNVYALGVPSNQSGSDHPNSGIYRDTYFNSSYDSLSDLLITVPPNELDADASHGQGKIDALIQEFVPACTLSVLLVNDIVPGGSDGFDKTAIFSSGQIAFLPHEVGHVLAGLGDEYTYANPGYPDIEEPNTTRETRRDYIKWKAWIATNTPIPTPETYSDRIGLFQGAHYHATGWYRPKLDCAMRSTESEFCEVCAEALVLAFYTTVRPIDTFTPANTNLASALDSLSFSVALVQPRTHNLLVQWYTNATPMEAATNLTLSGTILKPGTTNVQARVFDPTTLVRSDVAGLLSQRITWNLVRPQPTMTMSIAIAGTDLVITGSGGSPGATCTVLEASDLGLPLANWTAVQTNVFDAAGTFSYRTPIPAAMPAGFYRLRTP